jgi:hypothetical protein
MALHLCGCIANKMYIKYLTILTVFVRSVYVWQIGIEIMQRKIVLMNYKIKVCNIKTNTDFSKLQPCDIALRKLSFLTLKLHNFVNTNEG